MMFLTRFRYWLIVRLAHGDAVLMNIAVCGDTARIEIDRPSLLHRVTVNGKPFA